MSFRTINFQLSIFWNINNIDAIIAQVMQKFSVEDYLRTKTNGPMPIYNIETKDRSKRYSFSNGRFDAFYKKDESEKNLEDFLVVMKCIYSVIKFNIYRYALNYSSVSEELSLSKRLLENYNISNMGNCQEFAIRYNDINIFENYKINLITSINDGLLQDEISFENKKVIVFALDINNSPLMIYEKVNEEKIKKNFEFFIKLYSQKKEEFFRIISEN